MAENTDRQAKKNAWGKFFAIGGLSLLAIWFLVISPIKGCVREDAIMKMEGRNLQQEQEYKWRLEEGLYIPPGGTQARPHQKKEVVRVESGNEIAITTPCGDKNGDFIAYLEPGENIQIRHVATLSVYENRCSFSITGDALPIFGLAGGVNRGRYRNDLPFQEIPAHAVVFYTTDKKNVEYIRQDGGIINFKNTSSEKEEVRARYNYPDEFMNEQVGWDGSTVKIKALKYAPNKQL